MSHQALRSECHENRPGADRSVFLPLLFNTTSQLCGACAAHTVGYQNAAGTAGGALIPAVTGLLMQRVGVGSLNPWLVGLAVCMAICHLVALNAGSRKHVALFADGKERQ